jgi:hypothetical protein
MHALSGAAACAEGDGAKLYASCLTFYDRVPSELCARHEDLLGAVALKALCLLSRKPYLTTSQQVRQIGITVAAVREAADAQQLEADLCALVELMPRLRGSHLGSAVVRLCAAGAEPPSLSARCCCPLQVLQELHSCALQRGSSIPVPDIINSLLAVHCPAQGGPKVWLAPLLALLLPAHKRRLPAAHTTMLYCFRTSHGAGVLLAYGVQLLLHAESKLSINV